MAIGTLAFLVGTVLIEVCLFVVLYPNLLWLFEVEGWIKVSVPISPIVRSSSVPVISISVKGLLFRSTVLYVSFWEAYERYTGDRLVF